MKSTRRYNGVVFAAIFTAVFVLSSFDCRIQAAGLIDPGTSADTTSTQGSNLLGMGYQETGSGDVPDGSGYPLINALTNPLPPVVKPEKPKKHYKDPTSGKTYDLSEYMDFGMFQYKYGGNSGQAFNNYAVANYLAGYKSYENSESKEDGLYYSPDLSVDSYDRYKQMRQELDEYFSLFSDYDNMWAGGKVFGGKMNNYLENTAMINGRLLSNYESYKKEDAQYFGSEEYIESYKEFNQVLDYYDLYGKYNEYYSINAVTVDAFNQYVADNTEIEGKLISSYECYQVADSQFLPPGMPLFTYILFKEQADKVADYYSRYAQYNEDWEGGKVDGEVFTERIRNMLVGYDYYTEADNNYVDENFVDPETYSAYTATLDNMNKYYFSEYREIDNPYDIFAHWFGEHDYEEYNEFRDEYPDLHADTMMEYIVAELGDRAYYTVDDKDYIREKFIEDGENYTDYLETMMQVDMYVDYLDGLDESEGELWAIIEEYISEYYGSYGSTPYVADLVAGDTGYESYIERLDDIDAYYSSIAWNGNPLAILNPAEHGQPEAAAAPEPATFAVLCLAGALGLTRRRK